MNSRNGIAIVNVPKKPKRKNAPKLSLPTTTMIHNKKGTLRLPDFKPVIDFMKRSGWE